MENMNANNERRPQIYYMDEDTGEVTENHCKAVEWYRAGATVGVYRNGRKVTYWYH